MQGEYLSPASPDALACEIPLMFLSVLGDGDLSMVISSVPSAFASGTPHVLCSAAVARAAGLFPTLCLQSNPHM